MLQFRFEKEGLMNAKCSVSIVCADTNNGTSGIACVRTGYF